MAKPVFGTGKEFQQEIKNRRHEKRRKLFDLWIFRREELNVKKFQEAKRFFEQHKMASGTEFICQTFSNRGLILCRATSFGKSMQAVVEFDVIASDIRLSKKYESI